MPAKTIAFFKPISLLLVLFLFAPSLLAQTAVGDFSGHADIGGPKLAGSAQYDDRSQTYTLKGSGYNIWFNRDEFQYLYNSLKGDFILTADFAFEGSGGDPHRKLGWMIRESTADNAAHISAVVHGDGLAVLQWRLLRGAYMRDPEDEIFFPKKAVPQTIQLERAGKKVTMRVANRGEPLQVVGEKELPDLNDSVLAGLFISAHDSSALAAARVWNVRIDKPVANAYHPNPIVARMHLPFQGALGSRLEIMDVSDGKRTVVFTDRGKVAAPIWMPDGKKLLFNQGGSLYTIPVSGGKPGKLHTEVAAGSNGDYGLSFNGKMLAVSRQEQPGSAAVYVLPLAGGTPKQLTQQTPSHGHGWSPDGKYIAVVGKRKESSVYNLYKVSVSNGTETALTANTTGHVDGPEYAPDGRFIYYTANPTGTMHIWRMKPDGSGKEQLTFDEYHNWFPHVSPDGKWLVFLSFLPDADPASTPSYQRVMLRLMPTAGGAPRVLAHLYGGQGTINANSWSPDSRHIAFVSNGTAPGTE